MSKMLEIGLDYNLDSEDEERLQEYTDSGMTQYEACRQVAQNVFGSRGGIVQQADLVDF